MNIPGRLAIGVLAAILSAPASAQAFYWAGWPGSGTTTQPPSITSRQVLTDTALPPETTFTPTDFHEHHDAPKGVPEPATLVIAGFGLGVVGLRKVLKRKK